MSCCNNKKVMAQPQKKIVTENYHNNRFNPFNFNAEASTYTIDGNTYYAAPWPMMRTDYDNALQQTFSTAGIPDFLNFTSVEGAPGWGPDITQAPIAPVTAAPARFGQNALDMRNNKMMMINSPPNTMMRQENRKSIFKGRVSMY